MLALASCTPAPPRVDAQRSSTLATAPPPIRAATPVIQLTPSRSRMVAGGCIELGVALRGVRRADVGLEVEGGTREAFTVRVTDGHATRRICEGWAGRRILRIRATAAGLARPSDPATIHIRPAGWMLRIQRLVGTRQMSVAVEPGGTIAFAHEGDVGRAPASNEKLLLSMALLDRFGTAYRIPTVVRGEAPRAGTVHGHLWLVGHGDPEFGPAGIERLAIALRAHGVRRVQGSVVGVTSTFDRRRWAPGWHRIALRFVGLPTALTFEGNAASSRYVFDPERRAAALLKSDLRSMGVPVRGRPQMSGEDPRGGVLAKTLSSPLRAILQRQNMNSVNLDAEVLGSMLGDATFGSPGSIAKGAAAIRAWAASRGVRVVAHDASGLSYTNRVSADGVARLLHVADLRPWGPALRSTLPAPGEGTLAGRLAGVRVRAKTGTLLDRVSALSGWVWLHRSHRWATFSILSRGLLKPQAVRIEDAIVRTVATWA
jgi:D-alanyl-D-alanine carboxypeptidase